MDLIVGIDLGTTNSEIAYVKDGQPHVIPDASGDPIFPSFVGLGEDGRLLVGHAARNQWLLAPDRTIKSIKRKMGQDVKVQLGGQDYSPQEISAMILRSLRDRAAQHLGCEVRKAVITVPAYFNDAQRQATREAGELAGLEVVRILNEPTAASLAYETNHTGLKRVLVYDLGGGTFDVSIVQIEDGVVEVLASHGDTQLGGDDFDQLLAEHIMKRFEAEHGVDLRTNVVAAARVLRAAEEAKKKLSFEPFATVQEEFIAEHAGKPLHLKLEIARHEFDDLVHPLLDKTITCVGKALDDTNLTPAQIDKVLLVGGSTRSPIISEMLQNRLGHPGHQEVHPDLCVALGASIQAAMIAGVDAGPVLVDITPHSLGMRCIGEVHGMLRDSSFSVIVPRNSALPTSLSQVYETVYDNQERVLVEVYQGEHQDVRANSFVGKFHISGLALVPAGNPIVVHMHVTLDGVLKVTATEKSTGLQKQVVIQNALAKFQREEREHARRRIDELFDESKAESRVGDDDEFPAEMAEFSASADEAGAARQATLASVEVPEQALHRAITLAHALIEKGERLCPEASMEDRAEIERCITAVRMALDEQDLPAIQSGNDQLADVLYYLEDAEAK